MYLVFLIPLQGYGLQDNTNMNMNMNMNINKWRLAQNFWYLRCYLEWMVQLVIQLWPELVKWTRSGVSNIVATHGLWAPGIQLTWIEMCSECKMHPGCWNQNKKENLNYFIEIFTILSHWRICMLEFYHFSNYNSFDLFPFTVCNVATRKFMIDAGGSH